jgi:DNA-binding Lrp family transcriptional regulator
MSKSSKDQIELDEKKILSELVKNAKENIDTIAKHCGFPRQKTWRMIKQLEAKGLFWGYTTVFDEDEIGLMHFTILVNRTTTSPLEKDIDVIVSRKTENLAAEHGITIESSYYVHGEYGWITTFTAEDVIQVKKFCDILIGLYPRFIRKITLIQTLMFMRKHYVLNPNRKKLKDFMYTMSIVHRHRMTD